MHFGVVAVVNIMLGLITPPYGLLLFIMVKIAEVPLKDLVREVMPFLVVMIAALALITFVPGARALSAAAPGLPALRPAESWSPRCSAVSSAPASKARWLPPSTKRRPATMAFACTTS